MKIPSFAALFLFGLLSNSQASEIFSYENTSDFLRDQKAQLSGGMKVSITAEEAIHGKHSLHLKRSNEGGSITIPLSDSDREPDRRSGEMRCCFHHLDLSK